MWKYITSPDLIEIGKRYKLKSMPNGSEVMGIVTKITKFNGFLSFHSDSWRITIQEHEYFLYQEFTEDVTTFFNEVVRVTRNIKKVFPNVGYDVKVILTKKSDNPKETLTITVPI